MQTAGAIPRGKAFQDMTEEAARDSIARWYKTAVTTKLREEKGSASPEIRAQRRLTRRLKKQDIQSLKSSPSKKPSRASTIEEATAEEQDDSSHDSSENDAETAAQHIAGEQGQKAIRLI